jgi:ABC-type spermidine/putrescine transport system permease subunit I
MTVSSQPLDAPPPVKGWHPSASRLVGIMLLLPVCVLLAVLVLWPLEQLVSLSLPGHSFASYKLFFGDTATLRALERTVLLSLAATVISIAIGTFLAWQMRIGGRVQRMVITAAVIFPLWTSLIVRLYALTIILERHGVLSSVLQSTGVADRPVDLLYTPSAVLIGMLYTLLPYTTLPLYGTFANVDIELTRASRSLGASSLRAFWDVVVPLATPAFIATAGLAFVISLGFYVTPVLLGGAQNPFMSNLISTAVFTQYDLTSAATAGTILLVFAVILMFLLWRMVGGARIRRAVAP